MKEFLSYTLFEHGSFRLTIGGIFLAIAILLVNRFLILVLNRIVLKRFFKQREIDYGRSFAIKTIIKYIMYFIAVMLIMKVFGAKLSVVLLGSAGLLVGIGLGLQSTFNDLLSGIILLVEGNVEIGDVVVIDGMIGVIQRIGLRTSKVKTRDMVSIIIPNHVLVGHNVTNWSHNESPARFQIDFGVAYHSDIDHVEEVALKCVKTNEDVLDKPSPTVQIVNYGASSLDFRLYFFSDEFFYIEKVKSDIRKILFKALKKNNIEIPFPQTDLWLKNYSPNSGNEKAIKGVNNKDQNDVNV
jgi:small-conductance mechanosensitive channel